MGTGKLRCPGSLDATDSPLTYAFTAAMLSRAGSQVMNTGRRSTFLVSAGKPSFRQLSPRALSMTDSPMLVTTSPILSSSSGQMSGQLVNPN
jgi:hypothetical protein